MTVPPPSSNQDRTTSLETRVAAALAAVRDRLGDGLDPGDASAMTGAEERIGDPRCRVVVCGEFKRGKSSLINALLRRPGLLPVDDDVATSVVTTVRRGDVERATIHTAAGEVTINVADLADYVTESKNPDNHRGVLRADVELNASFLADGVVLIDTPGIGGLNPEHAAATRTFLDTADAALVVTDAVEPLTERELIFLDMLSGSTGTLAFAVTKTDRVADPDTMVADVRAKVAERLARPPESLVVVPVSSSRRLDALAENDATLDAASGFGRLEHALRDTVVARVRAGLVAQGATAAAVPVERAVALLRTERKALRRRDRAEDRDALLAGAERLTDTLGGLLEPSAGWRQRVDERLGKSVKAAQKTVRGVAAGLREDLTLRLLADRALLDDPDEIGRRLVDQFMRRLSEVGRTLQTEADDLMAGVAAEHRVHRVAHEVGAPEFEAVDRSGLDLPEIRRTVWQKGGLAIEAARDHAVKGAMVGFFVGGAIGLVIGAAGGPASVPAAIAGAEIGQAIGAALGGVIASISGWRQKLKKMRRKDTKARRAELEALLLPFLEANERRAIDGLSELGRELRRSLPAAIADQLRQELHTAEEAVDRIRTSAKLSAAEAGVRLEQIDVALTGLRELQAELAGILAAADAVAAQPGEA